MKIWIRRLPNLFLKYSGVVTTWTKEERSVSHSQRRGGRSMGVSLSHRVLSEILPVVAGGPVVTTSDTCEDGRTKKGKAVLLS